MGRLVRGRQSQHLIVDPWTGIREESDMDAYQRATNDITPMLAKLSCIFATAKYNPETMSSNDTVTVRFDATSHGDILNTLSHTWGDDEEWENAEARMYRASVQLTGAGDITNPGWQVFFRPEAVDWRLRSRNARCVDESMRPQMLKNERYDAVWGSQQENDFELHLQPGQDPAPE